MNAANPYQLLGGDEGIRRLATVFYQVMSERPEAATIRAMHAASTEAISEKLYQYLSGWMGGPPLYYRQHGTVCLTHPHAPFAIGTAERDQWLACMTEALDRIGACNEVKEMLREPMFGVANMLVKRHDTNPCPVS